MISFSSVTYSRGPNTLVSDFSLTLFSGDKAGIVGANGCGKSTLFQLILGDLHTDEGNVDFPEKLRIAHVKQETPGLERTAINYVLDGDQTLRLAQDRLAQAEAKNDGEAIAEAHHQLELAGAYDAESRVAKLLYGLGFSDQQMQMKVSELSGGWRVRLNLAQALIQPSDLLLLDEPTNHLDLDAVFWLESFLKAYPGTLLIISHDRDFLDAIVGRVLHFDSGRIKDYQGNYTQFLRTKAEQEALQQKQFEKQQTKVKHLQSFIDRFKAKASKAKQAQSRIKALEKMATIESVSVREKLSFDFFEPTHRPDPIIRFDQVNSGYDNQVILHELKLSIRCDSRIGLLGRNGAGKSTLLKTIAKTEVTTEGNIESSRHMKVGYFAQHQLEQLRGDQSAFSQMQSKYPDMSEQDIRNYLGGFAFHGDKVFDPVSGFSGGEKARLVLALIIYERPNLILLDEPTNHLDMDMRDALTMAIQNFNGAVIIISHDRYLLDATVDELYLIDSGSVNPFDGDTQAYYQWLKQNRWGKELSDESEEEKKTTVTVDRKKQKQIEAAIRQQLAPIKKSIKSCEDKMEQYTQELSEIESAMSDSGLYEPERKSELSSLIDRQTQAKQKLEDVESEWMELNENLENQTKELEANHGG